jgi:hypothetical protein
VKNRRYALGRATIRLSLRANENSNYVSQQDKNLLKVCLLGSLSIFLAKMGLLEQQRPLLFGAFAFFHNHSKRFIVKSTS